MSDVGIRVAEDAEGAARLAAEEIAKAAAGGSIVLTGGSTPARAYELAAQLQPDWSGVEVWWGDERCVPPEHADSNFGLAKRSLLDRLEHHPARVHRIEGERGAEEAAAAYDGALAGARFDLLLLGIGPDGHVASLFPGAPQLEERNRRAVPAQAQLEPFVDRVTLTLPVLRSARYVLFLVTGEAKADAVRRAFRGRPDAATPASLVRSDGGRTDAIVDRAAALTLDN